LPRGGHGSVGRDRDQNPGDPQRRHVWLETVNIDPKNPAGRLEVHHPGVKDFDDGIGTLPVVSELTVLTEEILHV